MVGIKRKSTPKQLAETNREFKKAVKGMSAVQAYKYYDERKEVYKYNTKETKRIFKEMNFERCSFCTKHISDFDREMTVEHIRTKKEAPWQIFQWSNLLCSCKSCNGIRHLTPYEKDQYLDPTKLGDIETYFIFEQDGTIRPNPHILFLSVFTYYRRCMKSDGE